MNGGQNKIEAKDGLQYSFVACDFLHLYQDRQSSASSLMQRRLVLLIFSSKTSVLGLMQGLPMILESFLRIV